MDQDDALIQRVPSQETILPRHARSSNGRALKVAGLTVLACLLLAGQALTAYFVWGQRDHIKALTEGQEKLKIELSRKPSAGAPRMMQLPMKSMRLMLNEDEEKNAPKSADVLKTQCQLGSDRKGQLGFYSPQCDDQGNYLPKQCWHSTGYCWCVDNEGNEIIGTSTRGRLECDSVLKTLHRPLRRMSEMKETLPLMKLQPTHQILREGSGLQEASVQALPVMRKMQSPIAMMPLLDEKNSEDSAE